MIATVGVIVFALLTAFVSFVLGFLLGRDE